MREAIYARLIKVAVYGVGIATVEEIDSLNIYWARMLAMSRAVDALGLDPAMVLVDGNRCPRWERPSVAIVAGDAKCRSIAAASIVAKVTRDRMMLDFSRNYPGYGWETNQGYPTPAHQRALRELGPTPLHRRSFAPVRLRCRNPQRIASARVFRATLLPVELRQAARPPYLAEDSFRSRALNRLLTMFCKALILTAESG